jgi:hypothetical protein
MPRRKLTEGHLPMWQMNRDSLMLLVQTSDLPVEDNYLNTM